MNMPAAPRTAFDSVAVEWVTLTMLGRLLHMAKVLRQVAKNHVAMEKAMMAACQVLSSLATVSLAMPQHTNLPEEAQALLWIKSLVTRTSCDSS
jgi:hypothetical protein